MAKKDYLIVKSIWNPILKDDKKSIVLNLKGMKTSGTQVGVKVIVHEWNIESIVAQYSEILKERREAANRSLEKLKIKAAI